MGFQASFAIWFVGVNKPNGLEVCAIADPNIVVSLCIKLVVFFPPRWGTMVVKCNDLYNMFQMSSWEARKCLISSMALG